MLWIDGDGCPREVKEIIYRAAARKKLEVALVVNRFQNIPKSLFIRIVVVDAGPDKADQHILDSVTPGELVVTADVPFAAVVLKRGGEVITPHGEVLDSERIGERLAMRNFYENLRSEGTFTGGGGSYSPKHKQLFAAELDRWISRHLKKRAQ